MLGAVLVPTFSEAAEPLRPARVTVPPVIDGILDDAAWQQAPHVTGFKTWMPDYGVEMADQTIVYYAYDAENLYFAFRAFDREPSKIKASVASRDTIGPDDWVCINLDSFGDQQSLYALYINPVGIQNDSRFAAGREDFGFDTVWYSAGRIDEQGYTVEVRIPFKSLRYGGGNLVTMGVIFERKVTRRNEDGTYPALDPRAGTSFLIQTAPIEFADVKHYTLLEVLPDVTYSHQSAVQAGQLTRLSSGGDLGVSAKYGITAQLTADGTYNPDFSQVEADAGQIDVNLRHPLFFAEKRPFFLEGQDVFTLGGPSQHGTLQSVVHTRNIVNPLAGVKVTGKLARADTIASIYALDELPTSAEGSTTDRYAHFAILRYKRSLSQDSYLGGFYTGREQGTSFNRVAGGDGAVRVSQSSFFGFHALGSSTRQQDAASATAGHALGVDFTRDTRNLTLYFSGADVSKTFATETGYLTRNGLATVQVFVSPKFYPKRSPVQRIEISAVTAPTRDGFSGIWETYHEGQVTLMLRPAITVQALYHRSTEVFREKEFGTSGVSAAASVLLTKRVRLEASFDHADAIYYSADPFGGRSSRASLTVVYQPSENWYQSLALTYSNFDRARDGQRLYDYAIVRNKTTYQVNRFLFFRGIVEYNKFRRQLMTDLLASFTYIPGTVIHAGYGSLYEKTRWDGAGYLPDRSFLETRRGLFFKASYLWRM